ncbi:MerC domain-containing protein [Woeseia oceani]|uniref:MerC mercury resistance protein n=1 Tax=Woeseia oceani TaxID=1548547 RepID=A0A193LHN5_9GAMM|nr:MerC domain-containing protein [Woeseia oceani]ANO51991.1 hypothetical protein BA177_12985 [Woeseia oceani]
MPQSAQPQSRPADLDRIAVVLSGLCLLHCLALPLFIALLPVVAEFAESHWHTPMLAIALPVSATAIVIGYRRHGNRALVAAGVMGLILLVTGATVAHNQLGAMADRVFTVVGSLLLAAVHWQNSRLLRSTPARVDVALAKN